MFVDLGIPLPEIYLWEINQTKKKKEKKEKRANCIQVFMTSL